MMPALLGYLFVRVCLKALFSDLYYLTSSLMICYSCPPTLIFNSYADDTQLFLHGLNPITTQTTLQSDLTLLSDWLHADIIEKLNESILRFVFNDFKNSYEKLSQEIKQPSLRARRINDMLMLVF